MRKLGCLICVLLMLLPLQGCKFKDLDLRLFVVALGVDASEENPGKLTVTAKLAVPLGDPKQSEEKVIILTEEADTIAEAVRRMKSRIDKEMDFGHCKAVIFGESYARRDLRQMVDWVLRRRDIQMLLLTAVGRPTAKEILNVQPKTERLPGNALLLALSADGTESPFIVPASFSYILERRSEEIGSDPILPVVEARSKDEYDIEKAYLFNKSKAVVLLDPDETRIYNMLRNQNIKTSLNVKYKGAQYAYTFLRCGSRLKLSTPENGPPLVKYEIRIQGAVEENSRGTAITESELKELSVAAEEQLNGQVEKVLKKIYKSGTDPLGWGLRYRARHWSSLAQEEQAWNSLYPELEFQAKSHIELKYTGMIR